MSDYEARFGALGRLYGTEGLARLQAARVAVIGLGGVGSWVVEALARSGIGELTLIDMDEVCLSNVNRQLHALDDTVGQAKAKALAERVRKIAPDCSVETELRFLLMQRQMHYWSLATTGSSMQLMQRSTNVCSLLLRVSGACC